MIREDQYRIVVHTVIPLEPEAVASSQVQRQPEVKSESHLKKERRRGRNWRDEGGKRVETLAENPP